MKKTFAAPNMVAADPFISQPSQAEEGFARICADPIASAFPRKTAVHAGMSGKMLAAEEITDKVRELHSLPRTGPAAAYVHLPYCESKCLYCGFFGGKYSPELGKAYTDALIQEIERESESPHVASAPINALYLGGGTPTALEAEDLSRLLSTLRSRLPLANDCEITVEGRIHNFGPEKMEVCLKHGANRFSLGVQTFHTERRRMLGRIAPKEEVKASLRRLASYNQAAVIVDLIYGLPGQTVEDWEDDIRTFLSLPLDGVDLYQLNVFPGSALAKAAESGKVPPLAPLAEQGRYFMRGLDLMQGARCRRLSLSHWSKTSRERNFYNPLAKTKADCLNFGAGAGGMLHGWFLCNAPKADEYLRKCSNGEKPVVMAAAPPEDLALVRVVLGQMELCRLNLNDVNAALEVCRPGAPTAEALFAPLFDNWEEAGLITRDGPWVEPTQAGQFWLVNLTQALMGRVRRMSQESL